MVNQNPIDPTTERIIERVERLLPRYEELQRTNALLKGQLGNGDRRARLSEVAFGCSQIAR